MSTYIQGVRERRFRPRARFFVALIMFLGSMTSCNPAFREVGVPELKEAWQSSETDSAVSWWYAGEKDGFEHFVRRTPLKQDAYRIAAAKIRLTVDQRPFSSRSNQWSNLKIGQLSFLDQTQEGQ